MGHHEETHAEENREEEVHAGNSEEDILENIPVPSSINQGYSYNFKRQVNAIFKRKYYCTVRNKASVFQLISPFLYLILAINITSKIDPVAQPIFFMIMAVLGFVTNNLPFTAFPVIERETNSKYFLRTIGLHPLAYWLGTFLFDIIPASIFGIVLVPVAYLFGLPFVKSEAGSFFLAILPLNLAMLTQSYVLSWLYEKQAMVYRLHSVLVTFVFFYSVFFPFEFLVLLADSNAIPAVIIFVISFFISPPMLFLYALVSLNGPLIKGSSNTTLQNLFNSPSLYLISLICQSALYFGINYLVELHSLKQKAKYIKPKESIAFTDHIPNPHEILQEAQKTEAPDSQELIKAISLEKTYENGFQALRGVTFGVERKQIFGLLGPNGAGKSTTFNILTGLIPKSSGHVVFDGRELTHIQPELFQNTGVCPQFDALWEHLTIKEHLELVGKIKGLDETTIQDSTTYYTKVLRMEEHLNKKVNQLSGGTKRKLCVANMLIGIPTIQFMDEPSTGLDPLSKRSLYDVVVRNLEDRNASIILTTHSMSEAESLCSTIGILINGKFVCIGTLPYLKSRYGTGYKIAVVKMKSDEHVYDKAIMEAFPTATREHDNSEMFANYRIVEKDFSFRKAFTLMENLKKDGSVSDFNIMNTTLEQVFIQFSRKQINMPVN